MKVAAEAKSPSTLAFRCNICGRQASAPIDALTREEPTCSHCRSTVRMRSIIHILTSELFGKSLYIGDLPHSPEISGIGLSDWQVYADCLAKKFAYTNTFYHKQPKLDIMQDPPEKEAICDFLISTDVFEHVAPPVSRAFVNAFRLLKPGGLFIVTVPYRLDGEIVEHFPNLDRYEIVKEAGKRVLKNITRTGEREVFDDLCFHGGDGSTLEMRVFSEQGLLRELERAGFEDITIHREEELAFGVCWPRPWSLPLSARKPNEHSSGATAPKERVPEAIQQRRVSESLSASSEATSEKYDERIRNEISHANAHIAARDAEGDSDTYYPKIAAFSYAMQIYSSYLALKMPNFDLDGYVVRRGVAAARPLRMLSLGSGMGENEIAVASRTGGRIELTLADVNPNLLERGAEVARRAGVPVSTLVCDVNAISIKPGAFDLIVCRSAIHHFLALERIFAQIKDGLAEGGEFLVIGESIGRNGLKLYTNTEIEAQKIFDCLPDRHRRNAYTGVIDGKLPNIDFSEDSMEAIRSQEILPLLLKNFAPAEYVAYDAFTSLLLDFRYGPNYDVANEHDRAMINFIVRRDIDFIESGLLMPTSMFGIFR